MLTITAFWGGKHFTYKSLIAPLVGDLLIGSEGDFKGLHFTVIELILTSKSEDPELLCITLKPTA